MYISIDTTEELSPTDRRVLEALIKDTPPVEVEEPKPAPEKKAAAKKAAPAPKPEPEPEPEDETEEGSADLASDIEDLAVKATEGPTLEDAISLATKLVSGGKQAEVKAAIKKVGAKRVSTMDSEQIAAFISILKD